MSSPSPSQKSISLPPLNPRGDVGNQDQLPPSQPPPSQPPNHHHIPPVPQQFQYNQFPPGYFAPPPGLGPLRPESGQSPVYNGFAPPTPSYHQPFINPTTYTPRPNQPRYRPPPPQPSFHVPDTFGDLVRNDPSPQAPFAPPNLSSDDEDLPANPFDQLPRKRRANSDAESKSGKKAKKKSDPAPAPKKPLSKATKKDPTPRPKPKKKPKVAKKVVEVDDDDDDDDEKENRKGRSIGATEYTNEELRALVDLVAEWKPLGPNGWENVHNLYNTWARRHGFPERERKPLQQRFGRLILAAKTKPTGDAERLQLLEDALTADSLINERIGTADLQDKEEEKEVVELSSSSEDEEESEDEEKPKSKGKGKQVAKGKGKEKEKPKKKDKEREIEPTVLTKSYKTDAPLSSATRPSRISRSNQATELLATLSSSLDPSIIAQRDETRSAANLQLFQYLALQRQVTEMSQQMQALTQRAQEAETELKLMKLLHGSGRDDQYHRDHRGRSHGHSGHWSHDNHYSRGRSRSPPYRGYSRFHHDDRYDHRGHTRTHARSRSPFQDRTHWRARSRSPFQDRDPWHARSGSIPRYTPPPAPDITTFSTPGRAGSDRDPPIAITPRATTPPVVVASSRVTLDHLAHIASGLENLDAGDVVTVKPRGHGEYDVEVSPSKRPK
ncbi:hypothetical protein VNI00_014910 [Paramarasmius palmivorus]|uniref:Myb-like domain-containing protein n=1 Tax=Paramarasmius palmivorus TaxID=297713 RepID=A0AAW0BP39_9AGAR